MGMEWNRECSWTWMDERSWGMKRVLFAFGMDGSFVVQIVCRLLDDCEEEDEEQKWKNNNIQNSGLALKLIWCLAVQSQKQRRFGVPVSYLLAHSLTLNSRRGPFLQFLCYFITPEGRRSPWLLFAEETRHQRSLRVWALNESTIKVWHTTSKNGDGLHGDSLGGGMDGWICIVKGI